LIQSAVAQNADGVMIPQVVYKINLMNELTKDETSNAKVVADAT
jgi:hypothetical protein